MRQVSQKILDEMIKSSVSPAVKFDIVAYDWPDKASYTKHQRFDWKLIHKNASTGGGKACVDKDGYFIITNGTTTKSYLTPDENTDFSGWSADGTVPPVMYYPRQYAICAHPSINEVMLFNVTPDTTASSYAPTLTLRYKKSVDHGTHFGSNSPTFDDDNWTTIATLTASTLGLNMYVYDLCAGYKANGDMCVFMAYTRTLVTPQGNLNGWIIPVKRTAGVWGTFPTDNGGINSWTAPGDVYDQPYCITCYHDATTTDWVVMCATYKTDYNDYNDVASAVGFFFYGDRYGNDIQTNYHNWKSVDVQGTGSVRCFPIQVTETKYKITSVEQLSSVRAQSSHNWKSIISAGMSDRLKEELGIAHLSLDDLSTGEYDPHGGDNHGLGLFHSGTAVMPSVKPYCCILKPPALPAIASVWRAGKVIFYEMRSGDSSIDCIFRTATTLNNDLPLFIACDTTYIYAYNGNQIFRSRFPGKWVKPTIGTGAGASKTITQDRIYSFSYSNNDEEPGVLYIICDNHDDYFDAPPAIGGSNVLYVGSMVKLYIGYKSSGTSYYTENSRWFIESWGYSRRPNESLFILKCVNAWWLLENYKLNESIRFNWAEDGNEKTVYEIIEMLVNAIGGTLYFKNRSATIKTMYPRVDETSGIPASNLVKRLLGLVPDKIRWFGNDGYIYYPQSSDVSVYQYSGPT